MFDRGKTLAFTGEVKDFQMINPHSWLEVAFMDPEGKGETWSLEMGPPGTLRRDGWSQTSVQPGDTVTIKLHPMKDGSHAGQLINARLADGKTLGGGGPEAGP